MKLRFTTVTAISLMMMATGLYLAWFDGDAPLGKQAFFTLVGILGLMTGSKLVELEERVEELESREVGSKQATTALPPESAPGSVAS